MCVWGGVYGVALSGEDRGERTRARGAEKERGRVKTRSRTHTEGGMQVVSESASYERGTERRANTGAALSMLWIALVAFPFGWCSETAKAIFLTSPSSVRNTSMHVLCRAVERCVATRLPVSPTVCPREEASEEEKEEENVAACIGAFGLEKVEKELN